MLEPVALVTVVRLEDPQPVDAGAVLGPALVGPLAVAFGAVVESLLIAATAFSVRYLPSSRKVLPEGMVRKAEAKDV